MTAIDSALEERIARLREQAERQRQSSIEWAAKAGQLQGIIDGLTSAAERDREALAALRLWRTRAKVRMVGIHDDLLERETVDGNRGGDGTGMDAARCRELRERLGRFLDDRDTDGE